MPLCGAVTKLTRPSPNTDGCTLRTPLLSRHVSGVGWTRGEKNREKPSAERDWRRYTQTPPPSVKGEGEAAGSSARRAGGEVGKGCEGGRGPGEVEGGGAGKGVEFRASVIGGLRPPRTDRRAGG